MITFLAWNENAYDIRGTAFRARFDTLNIPLVSIQDQVLLRLSTKLKPPTAMFDGFSGDDYVCHSSLSLAAQNRAIVVPRRPVKDSKYAQQHA